MEDYHDIEKRLRPPTLKWADDSLNDGLELFNLHLADCLVPDSMYDLFGEREALRRQYICRSRRVLDKCQQVADFVAETLGMFDPVTLSGDWESASLGIGFRHGPGAVAEQLRQHEKSCFPNWPAKLEYVFPFGAVGKPIGSDRESPSGFEEASRLICVPKTAKSPRIIAAEPVAHQWCQQMLRTFVSSRIKDSFLRDFIDFNDQSKSGSLVLQASTDRKLATVDLSDASDRLSCWTVERVFRKNPSFLHALYAARTRLTRDNISREPGFLSLRKFASQGAATTFPVQSLVFLVIALACSVKGQPTITKILGLRNRVRVFGDDIILPAHGYEQLCEVMRLLQLKVNEEKSYITGHYRESCGVDGYRGHDVTPVKPKTLVADGPESAQAIIDTSNNLFKRLYWRAAKACVDQLPPRIRKNLRVVGMTDSGFSGLASFSGSFEDHLEFRWNKNLHRYDVKVWTSSAKTLHVDRDGFEPLLEFFSRPWDPSFPRVVSKYDRSRKVRYGLAWEPHNTDALHHVAS